MPHRRLTEADPALGMLRAESFALVTGRTRCDGCRRDTRTSSLLLRGYEEFLDGEWIRTVRDALLTRIYALDARTYELMAAEAPWMLFAHAKTTGATYLAAYCEHCSAAQERHGLGENGGVFFPITEDAAAQLMVKWFKQPVLVQADSSWPSWTGGLLGPAGSSVCT